MTGPPFPSPVIPTFLSAQIAGAAQKARVFGRKGYIEKLQKPGGAVLREVVEKHGGYVDHTTGDFFLVVFAGAEEALDCAREIQERLRDRPITAMSDAGSSWSVEMRIGVHTAEREVTRDRKRGYRDLPDAHFVERVMGLAAGNQIFITALAYRAASNTQTYRWRSWPGYWITCFEDAPQTLLELLWKDGTTFGAPGRRWLPAAFCAANDRYIARLELESQIFSQFATPQKDADAARLVTLRGNAGIGKTRLAIACALPMSGVFAEGVYFVRLQDRQPSAQSLAEAISAAIKESDFAALHDLLPEKPATLNDLLPALHRKHVLLVLDGYEGVQCREAQEFLRGLLGNTRYLYLLVTGREAVRLAPEEKRIKVEGLTNGQATELFVARVRRQKEDSAWKPASGREQQALDRILSLTDRIPLALELLAAQIDVHGIVEIAESLERTPSPTLLEGPLYAGSAECPPALTCCLDYIYSQLDADQQRCFAALSLFAARLEPANVAGVCGLSNTAEILSYLAEKSFLSSSRDADGHWQRTLPRLLRAYAAERLEALPDAAILRAAYVSHYCKLVVRNHNINDLRKQAVLEREWPNILAATDHAEAAWDAKALNLLSEYLANFMQLRGWWQERERLNRRALESARRAGDRKAEGRALNNLGALYQAQGRWQKAVDCFEQSLAISREYENRISEGIALNNLGNVYKLLGQWQRAIDCFEKSLTIEQAYGKRSAEGITLSNLGNVYSNQGRFQEALDCFEQSLLIKREYGDYIGEGKEFFNLSSLLLRQKKLDEAEVYARKSLAIAHFYKDRTLEGKSYNNLGCVYQLRSKWQEAKACYQHSLLIKREYGDLSGEAHSLHNLALISKSLQEWGEAGNYYSQSLTIFRKLGDRGNAGRIMQGMALLCEAQGNVSQALEWMRQALRVLETTEDTSAIEARNLIAKWEQKKPERGWWPFGR